MVFSIFQLNRKALLDLTCLSNTSTQPWDRALPPYWLQRKSTMASQQFGQLLKCAHGCHVLQYGLLENTLCMWLRKGIHMNTWIPSHHFMSELSTQIGNFSPKSRILPHLLLPQTLETGDARDWTGNLHLAIVIRLFFRIESPSVPQLLNDWCKTCCHIGSSLTWFWKWEDQESFQNLQQSFIHSMWTRPCIASCIPSLPRFQWPSIINFLLPFSSLFPKILT